MESWEGTLTTVPGGVTVSTGSVGWGLAPSEGGDDDDPLEEPPTGADDRCPLDAVVLSCTALGR
ncbi:MAG: hypothetical protein ACYCTZ_06005 [Candidatus Dormibacteria bacterium]